MTRFIKNFKKYQFLLGELVKKDIKLKYRRSYLGILWTLIEPLLTALVLAVVFSNLYDSGKGDKYFIIYILTGRLLYTFFANATKGAMKSIRTNSGMIKKVYVPKYIYPLSSVLSNYVSFVISLLVLVGASIVTGLKPTIHIIEAIIPLTLALIMAMGVGLILSTLAVFFRDLEYLWGVALMLIMYCSAIFYLPEKVVKHGFGWIFNCNPLYLLIVNFRNAVLYGVGMNVKALIAATVFSFTTLIVGLVMFYKQQDKFILHI